MVRAYPLSIISDRCFVDSTGAACAIFAHSIAPAGVLGLGLFKAAAHDGAFENVVDFPDVKPFIGNVRCLGNIVAMLDGFIH
jgi:ABC-type transport system involved in cytochrome c biogenesis permease component